MHIQVFAQSRMKRKGLYFMGCHCTKIWLTCDIYCYSAADQSLVIVTVKRRNRYVVKEASRKRVVLRLGIHVSLVLSDGFQFSHT